MLNLVVATKTEAEPLIDTLQLKHTSATFPLYTQTGVALVISGIGKCRAAAATSWLGAQTKATTTIAVRKKLTCWLNIGIAGHNDAPIGSIFSAHKIHDLGSAKVWYPARISPPLPSTNLTTVDKPLIKYIPDQLHDMEGSGFVETARMYSYAELVQCIKVVSDNTEQPFSTVNAQQARQLIADKTQEIIQFMDHLRGIATTLDTPNISIIEQFCEQWKFSVSQTIILERLLQRHSVFHTPMSQIPEELTHSMSAKDVLKWLTNSLNAADYSI